MQNENDSFVSIKHLCVGRDMLEIFYCQSIMVHPKPQTYRLESHTKRICTTSKYDLHGAPDLERPVE